MDDEVEVEEVEEGLGKLVALTRLGLPHHHHHPHHHKQSSPQLVHQDRKYAKVRKAQQSSINCTHMETIFTQISDSNRRGCLHIFEFGRDKPSFVGPTCFNDFINPDSV